MVHTDMAIGWSRRTVRYMEIVYSMEHPWCEWELVMVQCFTFGDLQ